MKTEAPQAEPSSWDLAFHLNTGRLCLNAAATFGDWPGDQIERWRDREDLGRWCVESGLLAEVPQVTERDLAAARALRAAVYRLVQARRAGGDVSPVEVALLNDWAARPALIPQLAAGGKDLVWQADAPVEAVLASVARDAVELLTSEVLEEIRECEAEDCSVLFIDRSRPGRRRWCSMKRCGNRMKKKAFRERRKAAAVASKLA